MRVVGVYINNYKSIGEMKNYLKLDPKVTALIGKNESGKSNVLEAIGQLSFEKNLRSSYFDNKNRMSLEDVSIHVDFEFTEKELEKYEIEQEKTKIIFSGPSETIVEGGLIDLIKGDEQLQKALQELGNLKSSKNIWKSDNSVKTVNELENLCTNQISNYETKLNNLKKGISRDYEGKDGLIQTIGVIRDRIEGFYNLLPQIYYRSKDVQLQSSYKYDDIKNILEDETHILSRFFIAAGIKKEDIIRGFESKSSGEKRTAKNKIEGATKKNIETEFKEFYNQENIEIQVELEGQLFKIYVKTGDVAMDLTERSNGLQWYLTIFIDIFSNYYNDRPILFLLDEPGVHLHVNAQKELLNFFSHLADKQNQVVYTTHSPYMIDGSNILNVRATEKGIDGNTLIYKNAYDQELSKDTKMETLSPVINALGADLKFNFGPSQNLNIVTEGITDYMYIKAMLEYLKVDRKINVIPSAGVGNVNRIASILIGWGCDFKIVLDYDKAGHDEYIVLVDKLDSSLKENIVFVNCEEDDIEEMKKDPKTIESLVAEVKEGTIENTSKRLAANGFYERIKSNIDPMPETVDNFMRLFSRLRI
ncbi:ATP-binding protein [Proteinivorax hydrogeniformans]|uniref:ATP-binding protein n=1 Tax=Proteinivorax hydrogeniformans TaxID=1826727 RepID=A0AAU8HQS3_9FIRM